MLARGKYMLTTYQQFLRGKYTHSTNIISFQNGKEVTKIAYQNMTFFYDF